MVEGEPPLKTTEIFEDGRKKNIAGQVSNIIDPEQKKEGKEFYRIDIEALRNEYINANNINLRDLDGDASSFMTKDRAELREKVKSGEVLLSEREKLKLDVIWYPIFSDKTSDLIKSVFYDIVTGYPRIITDIDDNEHIFNSLGVYEGGQESYMDGKARVLQQWFHSSNTILPIEQYHYLICESHDKKVNFLKFLRSKGIKKSIQLGNYYSYLDLSAFKEDTRYDIHFDTPRPTQYHTPDYL